MVIDLGFDVRVSQRVRLLGIDTPESRTRDLEEAIRLLSKKKLKQWCLKAVESEKDDIELELRCEEADSRGKFGRVLAEIWVTEWPPPMLTNGCVTKDTRFRMLVGISGHRGAPPPKPREGQARVMIVRAVFTRDVYRRHARPVLGHHIFTQARPRLPSPTSFIERLSLSLGDDGGKSNAISVANRHAPVESDSVCLRCVAIIFASLMR